MKPLSLTFSLAACLACQAQAQSILFRDTFDRPDNRNIDAVLTGITDNTGASLAADAVYSQPWLDPNNRAPTYGAPDAAPANGGGSQILGNVFQVKTGAGTANAYLNHNFTNAAILTAGGFSVSMDVTGFNQASANQGGAFGIGLTAAEAASMEDAVGNATNRPHMSAAFSDGLAGQTNALADFWVGLRGNSTIAWGTRDTVLGTTPVAAKTGTIKADFTVPNFNAGSTVGFQVSYNGTQVGSGNFQWTDNNANYIAMDGRDNTFVGIDYFTVSTFEVRPPRPNVVVILADDMGWGDLGCYGSEIPTPNLDALAANGVRFRQFYNSARCSPTRCSLLTGVYPQQAAVDPSAPLPDLRADNNVTFAEMLGADGYRTYMAGKWHLGNNNRLAENRGFQHVWRMANGTANNTDQWTQSSYTLASQNNEIALRDYAANGQAFYQTDAIGDYAVDYINHNSNKGDGQPFAMYMAFGAPHFPIQAPAAVADTFMSTYAQGWDVIRQERYNRQLAMGVIDSHYPFPARGGVGPHQAETILAIPAWDTLTANRQADLTRRMALYAAMIKKLDENVGKVVTRLQQLNQLDNTIIFFMSDNGANHESGVYGNNSPMTGAALTNMGQPGQGDAIHYGGGLAHVSNTPLKLFKHFTHEGGIRAPFIVHWPAGFTARNAWVETPAHLIDVVATIKDVTGAPHPTSYAGHPVLPLEGVSLRPLLNGQPIAERPLFVEHESNRMIRKGKWKLVTESFTAFDNEFGTHQKLLYDMDADPGEATDLAAANPAKVVELVDEWNAWSSRVGLPASRLMVPTPLNLTPGPTPADLFVDSFNRANATDIDASNSGMSGSRVPPLGSGTTWFEGWEGSGTADSIQVTGNILQMSTGAGMSEDGLNHNFTGQDILDAGGFSVSLRVLGLVTDATDAANRYAGFAVGLNAAQAAAGNDIGGTSPPSIRGNGAKLGSADAFLELDLNGNVKLWTDGVLRATVPVGKNKGTLTASYACSSFAAGATVTVSAWFDGTRLDLDPGSAAMTRSFTWDEADANYLALSARATEFAQMDNFAVRKLPISHALAVERALSSNLQGSDASSLANPDGDRLDNFGEWAFGTAVTKPDDHISATSLVLAHPANDLFRFAHRRLISAADAGLRFRYRISGNLTDWTDITPVEESATALSQSPGYEVVTLSLPASSLTDQQSVFVRVMAEPM